MDMKLGDHFAKVAVKLEGDFLREQDASTFLTRTRAGPAQDT